MRISIIPLVLITFSLAVFAFSLMAPVGLAEQPTQIWATQVGPHVTMSPVYINGIVSVGSWDGKLYAINTQFGATQWSYDTHVQTSIYSTPAIYAQTLYFGTSNGRFYAIDALQGRPIWNYTVGSNVDSSPTTFAGVVFSARTTASCMRSTPRAAR